jgi:hypothetical protein
MVNYGIGSHTPYFSLDSASGIQFRKKPGLKGETQFLSKEEIWESIWLISRERSVNWF